MPWKKKQQKITWYRISDLKALRSQAEAVGKLTHRDVPIKIKEHARKQSTMRESQQTQLVENSDSRCYRS